MRTMLLILMVLASVATVNAKIGWTLDQCRKYWGQETDHIVLNGCPPPQETRPVYVFHYGKRYIVVDLDENWKVIRQILSDSSHL